jgi:hypothetical protein
MTIHGTGKTNNMEQMLQKRTFNEKLNYAMPAENSFDCFLSAVPDLTTKDVKNNVDTGAYHSDLLAQLVVRRSRKWATAGPKYHNCDVTT